MNQGSNLLSSPAPAGLASHTDELALICTLPFSLAREPSGRWAIHLRWGTELVSVREAEAHELDQIFALVYRVYIDERHLISSDQLPGDQARHRWKWDAFDHAPGTRHFVAVTGGRVVGCARLVAELDGRVPLDPNGFSLDAERAGGQRIHEIGKFLFDAPYRGRSLVDAFFALFWYVCREEEGIDTVFLSCEPRLERLYAQAGATLIGRFHNAEFDREYSAMRIDIVDDFRQQFQGRITGRSPTTAVAGALDTETLTKVVRQALHSDTVEVSAWHCQAISGGGGSSTGGVHRIRGSTNTRGPTDSWSVVLKEVVRSTPDGNPRAGSFWRREPLAYGDGTLASLPEGIRAPSCFGVVERDDAIWLFLEDVENRVARWGMKDFERSARQLGRWNGAYAAGRPIPTGSWVSDRWLRDYVESAAPCIAMLPRALENPLVRRLFPGDSLARVMRIWEERHSLLRLLDALPSAFCHLDAVRRNLFLSCAADGSDELVAIDWAAAGRGPLGQEIAPLVLGSVLMFDAGLEEIRELDGRVFAAYVGGLRESGWQGEPRLPRLGFAISGALRYTLYGVVRLPVLLEPALHAWAERVMGRPLVDIIDRCVGVREYALALADEVYGLPLHAEEL